jgi:glucose/arabinose dehydrogenase
MKKRLLTLLLLCCMVLLVLVALFSWKNLRGVGPALRSPAGDIARLIGEADAVNRTKTPLTLRKGFTISVFARGLGRPRVMVFDPAGTLLVTVPSKGRVVALPDRDRDGTADRIVEVIGGLDQPHGMAFRCSPDCGLYIAEEDQVNVYSYDPKDLKAVKQKKIANLPEGGHHTRTLLFLPEPRDDRLLVSAGSSCNVCLEDDWRRAKILVVPAGGGDLRAFASGLRNAVFMAIHPKTKKVWATEMGRDMLGDDLPPDEINIIEEGRDYGWPFCYGKNIRDPDFNPGKGKSCREPETFPSYIDVPAHSAPLGLSFFPEDGWPEDFRNNLLVAFHGSWNRSVPTGYKIVRYRLDEEGRYLGAEDFVTGWLTRDGTALGRPVDIIIRPDGTIFVSDDKAGVIYRITRDSTETPR